MSAARELILSRIRRALEAEPASGPPVAEAAVAPPDRGIAAADRFAATVADYRAEVLRVADDEVAAALDAALDRLGADRVAIADGLAERWRPSRPAVAGNALDLDALDALDAVVTGSRLAIARTGTIVLDHAADQGPRRLTLVPDRHLCVVRAADVVADVADAFAAIPPPARSAGPLTLVSGPSATSDIELQRVEGVHGPRTLVVVLVDDIDRGGSQR